MSKFINRLNRNEGLTLVEVMVAMMVFAVGIVAVAQMQIGALHSHAKVTRRMYDTMAAGVQLEDILSWEFHDPRLTDTDNGFYPDQPDHGPFPLAVTNSTIEWEIDDNGAGAKRVAVTIRWADRGARPMKMIYEYMKLERFS